MADQTDQCTRCFGTGYVNIGENGAQYLALCQCAIERDIKRKLALIGPRNRWASLDILKPCDDPSKVFVPVAVQAQVIETLKADPDGSFAFFGRPGVAKSTCFSALWRHAVETQRDGCFLVRMPRLLRDLRDLELGRDECPYLSRLGVHKTAARNVRPRVFIEEFDKVTATEFARNSVHELIDELYELADGDGPGAQLVIATNLDRATFSQVWGAHILRRVEAVCEILDFFDAIESVEVRK